MLLTSVNHWLISRGISMLQCIAIPLGCGALCASLIFWQSLTNQQNMNIAQDLQDKAELLNIHIHKQIESNIHPIVRMAKRWELRGGTPKQEWQSDALFTIQQENVFQAIQWVDSNFHVRWVEPIAGNEHVLNLNIDFEKQRYHSLINARNNKQTTVSPVIDLIQGQKGFIIYQPLFINNRFDGFIVGVIDLAKLLVPIKHEFEGYKINIISAGENIYSQNLELNVASKHYLQQQQIQFYNTSWTLQLWPSENMLTLLKSDTPKIALIAGIIFSILISLALFIAGVARIRAHKIAHKSQEITILYSGTRIALQSNSFEEAIQRYLCLVCKTIGWPLGHAYIPDADQELLLPSKIWFSSDDNLMENFRKVTESTKFKLGIGLPGCVWKNKKAVWVTDVQKDSNFPRAKQCNDLNIHGAVGFPIIIGEKVIAVLEFFSYSRVKENTHLLHILEMLGEQVGRTWEKRQIEEALRDSEERNRLILESAGEGIYGLDLNGCTTFVNRAAERMLGYEEKELIGQPMHTLIHHSYVDGKPYPRESCPMYAAFSDGIVHHINNEVLWRKDGSSFPIEYTSTPLRKNGKVIGAVVTFSDITEQLLAKEQLMHLAHFDNLTELANRMNFDNTLKQTINRAERAESQFAVLYLDLDYFKNVNDNLGHDTGDMLLKEAANRMRRVLRSYDFAARLGGDEFAIILQDIESSSDAELVAKELISTISQSYNISEHIINISVSIGIACYPQAGIHANTLAKNADIAMYAAKDAGRGTYRVFSETSTKTDALSQ